MEFLDTIDKTFGSFAAFLFLVALGLLVWRVVWPAVALLARSLYVNSWRPYSRAVRTLLGFLWLGLRSASLYEAARLRIESELIDPPPQEPLRLHHSSDRAYKQALAQFKDDRRIWREAIRKRLRGLVRSEAPAVIEISTSSPLITGGDGIVRYFDALGRQRPSAADEPGFLSRIAVSSGFIAPLHLLGGVLARYEEQWQPVVEDYGRSIIDPHDPLRYSGARRNQSFIFDCWLLWGPSIPLCTCPEWSGNVALQYGYGDENNSVSVRSVSPEMLRSVAADDGAPQSLALQVRVVGTLRWGPSLPRRDIPPAQHSIWRDERLVLDVTDPSDVRLAGGTEEQVWARYYSAYIWIAFVLCDAAGEPLHPEAPWRNLVPFFEHANVADADTYDFHTDQLAEKAAHGALRLLDGEPGIQLRFVCAIDESACGFPMTFQRPQSATIRTKLATTLERAACGTASARGRLLLAHDYGAPWKDGDYSSCALPAIIERYYTRGGEDDVTFRSLSASRRADMALLRTFYAEQYVGEFPDPDERESLANIEEYLRLRDKGWYGRNDYHVIVALDKDGVPVGGSISDYLVKPNAGVIEFLFVDPVRRVGGLGRRLLEETERHLHTSAIRSTGGCADWVLGEMDDPYLYRGTARDFDPVVRAWIWHRWGYRMLDFPYTQPALSPTQGPVSHLLLMAKTVTQRYSDTVPSNDVACVLNEYFHWAMRIPCPDSDPVYAAINVHLRRHDPVRLVPLDQYVGRDEKRPLLVREVVGVEDPEFAQAMAVYKRTFTDPATAVSTADFAAVHGADRIAGCQHHLWTLRAEAKSPCEGMASFATLPTAGFGGYLCLTGSLKRTGRLRETIARIEQRMVGDGTAAVGWYIECGDTSSAELFGRVGFVELAIDYRQPAASGVPQQGRGRRLHLLYKPFGRVYGPPRIQRRALVSAMRDWYVHVYRVANPDLELDEAAMFGTLPDDADIPTRRPAPPASADTAPPVVPRPAT